MSTQRKTVVITGGAGGLGMAMARRFAAGGASIALVDIPSSPGEEAAKSLEGAGEFKFFPFDITQLDKCEELAKNVYEHFGSLDVLCNNAGISIHRGTTETIDIPRWKKTLAVNLEGMFFMARAVALYMKKSGGGAIVNTSSIRSYLATGDRTIYAITKQGVRCITSELAADYWRYGIRVNSISPGYVLTKMTRVHLQEEGWLDNQLNIMMKHEMIVPEDIAEVVAFLASDDAAAISAADFPCDGGTVVCRGKVR